MRDDAGRASIRGPITLADQDGNEYDVGARKRVAGPAPVPERKRSAMPEGVDPEPMPTPRG